MIFQHEFLLLLL